MHNNKKHDKDEDDEFDYPQQSFFKCLCGQSQPLEPYQMVKDHIKQCKIYLQQSPFNIYFVQFMKNCPQEQMIMLHAEFELYNQQIKEKLTNSYNYKLNDNQQQNNNNGQNQIPAQETKNYPNQDFKEYDQNEQDPMEKNRDLVKCTRINCKVKYYHHFELEKIYYTESCCHLVCIQCMKEHIMNNYIIQLQQQGALSCPSQGCTQNLMNIEIEAIIGKKELVDLDYKLNEQINKEFIKCVNLNCNAPILFETGQCNFKMKNEKGRTLTKEQVINYSENRFKCYNCSQEQCKTCKETPYHLGYTCQELKEYKQQKICRYCDEVISKVDLGMDIHMQDICKSDECQKKLTNACLKQLDCGHACYGHNKELKCLECLHKDCNLDNQGDEYCSICYTETLTNAPLIKLGCNHMFHIHCITKKIELKWDGARIVFKFCHCPACNQWITNIPKQLNMYKILQESEKLLEKIKAMSFQRLKYEERLNDERLKDPNSNFFKKEHEYALAIYSYYQCFKCKKPYFGGLKNCDQGQDDSEFNPQHLVCAECCDIIPIEVCKKHGKEFIEFKCKFCCNIAQWFCWGTSHFCDPCHKRQVGGDYVSKYGKDKLPVCKGGEDCPLRVMKHPNAGEEYAMGCALCRNDRANKKEF